MKKSFFTDSVSAILQLVVANISKNGFCWTSQPVTTMVKDKLSDAFQEFFVSKIITHLQ